MYCGYGMCTVIPTYLWCGVVWFVCLLPRALCAKMFWVWGFYLRDGACYGYGDYLVWGLCVFELFVET